MSEVDLEDSQSAKNSETGTQNRQSSGDEVWGGEKLVPVTEAIRYRKRAQSAEQKAAALRQKLQASEQKSGQLAMQLDDARVDNELASRLVAAGARDLETAVLLAKARLERTEDEVDSVVEQLRKEKTYLFKDVEPIGIASKTAGVRQKVPGGQSVLDRAAKRAASSGGRADMAEYMRVRRQFV